MYAKMLVLAIFLLLVPTGYTLQVSEIIDRGLSYDFNRL